MKSSIMILAIFVALVAGMIVYLNREKAPPVTAPLAESGSNQTSVQPEKRVISPAKPPQAASQNANEPVAVSVATPASCEVRSDGPIDFTPFNRAVETLVSTQADFPQKQAAWKQLRDAGQLDQAIESLKQGAANNPASAEYPAALGQAELQKAGVISQNGGSISEMGILGMQADQHFDAALKIDPSNWEAQFFKAAAMSHWPLELNKGQEVVQRFSSLIDQQETMMPQPQFAQTYVLLGEQYQKISKPDCAVAVWRLGAAKFPNDPSLQKKISEP